MLACALPAVASAAAAPDAPPAPSSGFLVASRGITGYVGLGVFGQPPGSQATFSEKVGGALTPLATVPVDAEGFAPLVRAVTWRCDRPVRAFTVSLTTPTGEVRTSDADIRTPSCAHRLSVIAPRHVRRGALFSVRIVDSWGLGDQALDVCASGAGLDHRCRDAALLAAPRGLSLRFRPRANGQVRVAVAFAGGRSVVRVAAGTAKPQPRTAGPVLLTTGDSTIEGIDSVLDDDLGSAARVRTEAAPGTRLSGDGEAAWDAMAASQVERLRPRLTVISLGANEGYGNQVPGGGIVNCCAADWIAEQARRIGKVMDLYLEKGRGRVVWLLLPTPDSTAKAKTIDAANQAVIAAAAGREDVHTLDLRPIFSPDGRFHQTISRGGKSVDVRAPDGVHLSAAGQAIAADAVRALIAREGLLD